MKYQKTLRDSITKAINKQSLEIDPEEIVLEHPSDPDHGDVATPVVLGLFKKHEPAGSPRQLAEKLLPDIQAGIDQSELAGTQITIAGPGFINFKFPEAFLTAKMVQIVESRADAGGESFKGQKIVVEYSSPNIAKPFTVGHLRSTIIGDAVANILQREGAAVYRDNHLGDWGTQFGKQIYAIKTWGDEDQIENSDNPVKELVKLYVRFHQEAESNPELEDLAREWFKKLEDGDSEARRLWKKCIDWSWVEFDKIYKRLNVEFTENNGRGYGESFFEDKMQPIIEELEQKNLLTSSEGAKLVFFENDKYPPLMIVKKDGSTLYSTRDLATDKFRLKQYGSDVIVINEVGSEQALYFKQLFEIERMLGWYKPEQRVHIGHGLIRFKDKKMSTRKGNVVWLESVLDEAFRRVDELTASSNSELSDETKWEIAVGAIKYNDLKRSAHLPIVFDWDELLTLKGNSGPYLQYTFVRCYSLLQKTMNLIGNDSILPNNRDITKPFDTLINNKSYSNYQWHQTEVDLLRNLYKYSDVVRSASRDLAPQHICTYLYELAQLFNSFYAAEPILPDDNEVRDLDRLPESTKARLLLVLATALVVLDGLTLLGIKTVTKM